MEDQLTPIDSDEAFVFDCHPGVSCFNACCRDLNQFLTPYDIIRLKNHLGISSGAFLKTYTVQHIGPETGLPVIVLRPDAQNEMVCPFLTGKGCGVYPARPASCRMYPLARMAARCRETGRVTAHYALMKEAHCRGFREEKSQTVAEWIDAQELAVYNEMNDLMMEIIGLKMRLHPEPFDFKEQHLFHMACYDIDAFRAQVKAQDLFRNMAVDAAELAQAEQDDSVMLRLSLKWLKKALFEAG